MRNPHFDDIMIRFDPKLVVELRINLCQTLCYISVFGTCFPSDLYLQSQQRKHERAASGKGLRYYSEERHINYRELRILRVRHIIADEDIYIADPAVLCSKS